MCIDSEVVLRFLKIQAQSYGEDMRSANALLSAIFETVVMDSLSQEEAEALRATLEVLIPLRAALAYDVGDTSDTVDSCQKAFRWMHYLITNCGA